MKEEILKSIVSNNGFNIYKTICFGYKIIENNDKDFYHSDGTYNYEKLESDLIFLAIISFEDSIREDACKMVADLQRGGIKIRVITEDNKETAVATAKSCGILHSSYQLNSSDGLVMTGIQFRNAVKGLISNQIDKKIEIIGDRMTFNNIVSNLIVLSESSDDDQFILVAGLKELNEVVAVVGYEDDHLPALKASDVSFAPYLSSTKSIQQASDIILLEGNCFPIVTATIWGRNMYDCIRKLIEFQLTINIIALSISFIGAMNSAINKESLSQPLTAAQLL